MFRNCLSAAWGDLARNPMQSAIAIGGLAVGLMAAIIAGIVTFDAFSRDHFIPGYDRIYFAVMEAHNATGDKYSTGTPRDLGLYLRDFPEINAMARESVFDGPTVLRHGAIQAREKFAWADPEFFRIYRAPTLYGDLDTALDRPDGMVITLEMARKYFGHDNVVGQTLELNHTHGMTITAVIADFPPNASNENNTVFGSALAPFSRMSRAAGTPHMYSGGMAIDGITLVRLARGASLEALNQRASTLVERIVQPLPPNRRAMHFERADDLNMSERLHPGARAQLFVMEAVALVILILSGVNFVSLSIARSAQRGFEVAIRKAAGAARCMLVVQFLGEAILQVLFALCLAIALVEWSLPAVNAFLESGAVFDYWRDPMLAAAMLSSALVIGVLAGAYPALILSSFRPAIVLKGWIRGTAGGASLRQALVGLQFAALILFLISAVTVFRQNRFATTEAMRVSIDQTLIIRLPRYNPSLQDRIAALPGVRGAAYSSLWVFPGLPSGTWGEDAISHGGDQAVEVSMVSVGPGFLELYGLNPLAGRFFRSGNSDVVPDNPSSAQEVHYVINQEAMRLLGYGSASGAVGQPLNFHAAGMAAAMPGSPPNLSRFNGIIIGVVKDFSFAPEIAASIPGARGIPPAAYSIGLPVPSVGPLPGFLHVRLSGRDIPQTLAAIDDAWKKSGALDPIDRQFLDAFVQNQEATTLKEGEAFAVFAGIAMLLACLGLFGVSLSTAARRTKEIGIRKAMGARDGDILTLLLWQFAKPVLWANLIAWPLAWWAMNRWLNGFAYHVDLALWMFPAAGLLALLIALAAVSGQAILVARQKPVLALRYE
ncbi:MAG TPA: FtsX-like permease family protein [Rhizomicrobium sp.]|jgi:putative ABC transport system permease protein|nr:FtsX-like permease family protein [Rhizomicrobium sp.]